MEVVWRLLRVRQRVYRLRVSGPVSTDTVSQVSRALYRYRLTTPVAISLVVNSSSGSYVQSALLLRLLESFSRQRQIPVFSFIEDCALGPGYIVATAGRKVYVREGSKVGEVGTGYVHWSLKKAMTTWKTKRHLWVFPANKKVMEERLNPGTALKRESAIWLSKQLLVTHSNLISLISASRGELILDRSVLSNADSVLGRSAVTLGLADAVADEGEVLREEFGDVAVVDVTQHWTIGERLREAAWNIFRE